MKTGNLTRFALLLLFAAPLYAADAPQLSKWNVVLVTLDTVDPHRLGLYGGSPQTTPFLDKLGAESLVFDHAYCTTGSTGPSHATILSGVLPELHGVFYNGLTVRREVPWLPELLQSNGYYTVGSSVAGFMSQRERFNRGFSRFDCARDARGEESNRYGINQLIELLGDKGWTGLPQPFFAWVHLKGGHEPLVPIEPEFLARHSRDLSSDTLPASLKSGHVGLTRDQLRAVPTWRKYYDANLSEADVTLEGLYRSLERSKLLSRTILIITADHGESFDHGIIGEHWPSPWQSTLRIPLIIHASGRIKPGRVKDRLVSTEDIAPTIAGLLGLSAEARWKGVSAFNASPRRAMAAESPYATAYQAALEQSSAKPAVEVRAQITELRATGLFYWAYIEQSVKGSLNKLLYFAHEANDAFAPGFQLYDVLRDPSESHDLLQTGAVTRRQARAILARARELRPSFATPIGGNRATTARSSSGIGQPTLGLPAETIQILRSLGYIQ